MAAGTASSGEPWGLSAVREAIAEVEETTPVRRILSSAVEAIAASRPADIRSVLPRLMAYAKSLEYDARWQLATDVYSTILSYANSVADADVVITAHVQCSTCLRNLGDLNGAFDASLKAQAVARAVGDSAGFLRGRMAEASVARSRGNYPLAAQILDEAIEASERASMPDVRWGALHSRATVAGMSGEFELAIQLLYAALPLAPSQRDRDRILGDLATGFMELGFLDIARDAYLVVNATTQDKFMRWTSAMNMMEIAGRQRAEPVFDRYRRELGNVELPPYLYAKYLILVANGYRELGRAELGIPLFDQAIEFSRAHELNHLVFEAEEYRAASFHDSGTSEPRPAGSIPGEIAEVADAIRAMVSTAGAGD
jgi:tetratricopeptide (TPR) repeat protein